MRWNSKLTTYYSRGRKAYGFGDKLPDEVIEQMGQETFDEYVEKGWIDDGKPLAEPEPEVETDLEPEKVETPVTERGALFSTAESLGLKPHYRAGIVKLKEMIADYEEKEAENEPDPSE